MNPVLVIIGCVVAAQALLYALGRPRFDSRFGPRLASYRRSPEAWRAGLRALAPLQLAGGIAVTYGGATERRDDDLRWVVVWIALTGLGTYLGHRAAVRAAAPPS